MKIKFIIIGLVILCAMPWSWPITEMVGVTSRAVQFSIAMNASAITLGGIAMLFAGLTGGFPK